MQSSSSQINELLDSPRSKNKRKNSVVDQNDELSFSDTTHKKFKENEFEDKQSEETQHNDAEDDERSSEADHNTDDSEEESSNKESDSDQESDRDDKSDGERDHDTDDDQDEKDSDQESDSDRSDNDKSDDEERENNDGYDREYRNEESETDRDLDQIFNELPFFTEDESEWDDEDKLYTTEAVLNLIRNRERIDISEITYYAEDIQEVIDSLIKDMKKEGNDYSYYFHTIKQMIKNTSEDLSERLLNDLLEIAIAADEEDDVIFCVEYGADEDIAIDAAIDEDSADLLAALDAEADDDRVRRSAESNSLEAVGYFLGQDFQGSYAETLAVAVEQSHAELVELVLDYSELNQIYDLAKQLVAAGGEVLLPIFFDCFEVSDILTEIGQYGDLELTRVVLKQAANYLSETQMSRDNMAQLLSSFDSQLKITPSLLSYPKEKFAGSVALKTLREALDKNPNLNEEHRLAANFIGTPLSSMHRLFSGSPYHQTVLKNMEHYYRSAEHPLVQRVKVLNAVYSIHDTLPESKAKNGFGNEASLGAYRTPLEALNIHHAIKPVKTTEEKATQPGEGDLYDALLRHKTATCQWIVDQLAFNHQSSIVVNIYHDYPCLMIFIKKPSIADNKTTLPSLKAWTEIVISFFNSLVTYRGHLAGFDDIELLRRPSFGFQTPTTAPCGQSFRLNIGFIPREYAQILKECLVELEATLSLLNRVSTEQEDKEVDITIPADCFVKTDAFKAYFTKPKPLKKMAKSKKNTKSKKTVKPKEVPNPQNILALVWAKVDTKGNTAGTNLMRSGFARVGFSAEVYKSLTTLAGTMPHRCSIAFLCALQWGMSRFAIIGGTKPKLNFNQDDFHYPTQLRAPRAKLAQDQPFWQLASSMINTIQDRQPFSQVTGLLNKSQLEAVTELENCIMQKTVAGFYYHLEMLNEILFAQAIFAAPKSLVDPFGSDSEVEEESTPTIARVFGGKATVENGMRAAIAALHAGTYHLFPDYLTSKKIYKLAMRGAYYETKKAVELIGRFELVTQLSQAVIVIHDTNACVTDGAVPAALPRDQLAKLKVLIIDSTSATLEKYHEWVSFFRQSPNMEVLFFAVSGLKNEQNGADKNPYGMIRIFTKDKNVLKKLMNFIKNKEKPIESAVAHCYRQAMKGMGFAPTNQSILNFSKFPKPKPPQLAEIKPEPGEFKLKY